MTGGKAFLALSAAHYALGMGMPTLITEDLDGLLPKNWLLYNSFHYGFLVGFMNHSLLELFMNNGTPELLLNEMLMLLMDYWLFDLMDHLLVLFMNHRLMYLSYLFLVYDRLVVLMDNVLMLFMNNVLMVFMDDILMVLVDNLSVMFFNYRLAHMGLYLGSKDMFIYNSGSIMALKDCFLIMPNNGGCLFVCDFYYRLS